MFAHIDLKRMPVSILRSGFACLLLCQIVAATPAEARNPHFATGDDIQSRRRAVDAVVDRGSEDGEEDSTPPPTEFHQFNGGWKNSFKDLESKLSPDQDYVTWIIAEPKVVMDLRTAEHFRQSFFASAENTHFISHMMVGWSCHDREGKRLVGGAAMTGEDSNQTKKMVLSGWGMTPFYAVFTDGYLDDPEELDYIIRGAGHAGVKVAHITMRVPRENCQNMLDFFQAFLKHKHKPFTRFGINLEPLKFEGGGCGSFASALMTKAGVLASVQPNLWRELRGTLNLMGFGLGELPKDTELKIPAHLANSFSYVWPADLQMIPWTGNDGPPIRMVDPELGIMTLREVALQFLGDLKMSRQDLEKTGFAERRSSIVPAGPIDASFDRQASHVSTLVHREVETLQKAGLTAKPVKIGKFWGLLLQ